MVSDKTTQQQPNTKGAANKKNIKKEEELSEEDLQLKQDLEVMATRVGDADSGVARLALQQLTATVRESTSSMTAVPKPLKFLRPHLQSLKDLFNSMTDRENKTLLADILSMLSLTYGAEGARDCLKYKLQGDMNQVGVWGHEYVRHLAGEVGQEYQEAKTNNKTVEAAIERLVTQLCEFFTAHNSEAELCDLLIETERVAEVTKYADATNYSRICLYLLQCAQYLSIDYNYTDNVNTPNATNSSNLYLVCYNLYKAKGNFPDALRMALKLNSIPLMRELFTACEDMTVKQQLAFILSRQQVTIDTGDDKLNEIMGNTMLSEYFKHLASDLHSLEPKTPEDIYKTHLDSSKGMPANVDSATQNLASTFVNAFVNAGFGTDKLMTVESSRWVFKNKDTGMMSAAASLGMLRLWDIDVGFNDLDKYLYSTDNNIKAGALLGIGVVSCGVRAEMDPAFAFLKEYVEGVNRDLRLGSVIGLGLAYAGSQREDILELLMPIIADAEQPMEVVSIAALSLGLVYVGSCNDDISNTILQVLMEREENQIAISSPMNTLVRFLCLALGLLFLGKQEAADAMIEAAKVLNEKISEYCVLTIETCAYAGTGNVLKVQKLLRTCGEHIEDAEKNAHQAVAVLGIAMVAMGEEIGGEMAIRSFDHLLQYGEARVRRTVTLALGLMSVSNPSVNTGIMDTLSKLSHDSDKDVAQSAVFSLGLIGAGTNNARIGQLLRQLAVYYAKDPKTLFMVRIAQGLLFMGKGLLTLSPFHSGRLIMSPVAMAGLVTVMHAMFDAGSIILGKYHYFLYHLVLSMYPRMLVTVDENLKPLAVDVRVGMAVDTVAQAGRPKTITGFQTHKTPVLLQHGERAELATEQYLAVSSVLEGVVILRKNPEWVEDLDKK